MIILIHAVLFIDHGEQIVINVDITFPACKSIKLAQKLQLVFNRKHVKQHLEWMILDLYVPSIGTKPAVLLNPQNYITKSDNK